MRPTKPDPTGRAELMTPAEVSALIRVEIDTLADWRFYRRNLPFVRVGAAIRYRRADVEKFLVDRTVPIGD